MNKIFALFFVGIILLGVTVFAQEVTVEKKADDFIKEVAQQKGVAEENINGVKELDLNSLPEEVNIKNVDTTNLALYEINVSGEEKPVYVVTASSKFFKETVRMFAHRMLLSFGFSGEVMESTFLKTSTGVTTSLEKGYVMTRAGAVSGLSTNLEVIENSFGQPIDIVIYKNSEEVGFRNSFVLDEPGIYSDYDTISPGVLSFEKGDVISLKVNVPEGVRVKDVISLLEIETE